MVLTADQQSVAEANATFYEVLTNRDLSGMERLWLAHEAWELARDRLTAFLSAQHPEWGRDEVRHAVAKRLSHESG